MTMATHCPSDHSFGPWADLCRGGFDFTLLFEETALSILPCVVFMLMSVGRVAWVWHRKPSKAALATRVLPSKQLFIALLACENLALLVLWSVSPQQRTPATLAAQAIGLLSCLVLQALSYYEHCYNAAPSMLISLFLVLTIVFDAVHIRTLWLMSDHPAVAGISCAALGTKLLLLCVESWNKQGFLTNDALQISVELRSSLFGKALFLWLNRTLLDGYHRTLHLLDLSEFSDPKTTTQHQKAFGNLWQTVQARAHSHLLLLCTLRSALGSVLVPITPRIGMIAVTLTQPLLLRRLLVFVADPEASSSTGYGLIGAFAILYCLTAIFNAWYAHTANKFALSLREVLVSAIYDRIYSAKACVLDEGQITTFINVDMEHVIQGALIFHEIWASVATVGIAFYMLYESIGTAFLGPLFSAIVLSFLGSLCGPAFGARQIAWLGMTETRTTSSMIAIDHLSEVKATGISDHFREHIRNLRVAEVSLASKLRRLLSLIIVISAASSQLSMLSAYAGFAIISKVDGVKLDVYKLFTSLAILQIATEPLFVLIQGTPQLISAYACLGRIQAFLLPSGDPLREFPRSPDSRAALSTPTAEDFDDGARADTFSNELIPIKAAAVDKVLEIQDAQFSVPGGPVVLSDISVTVKFGDQIAIVGSVGSGKSSMLQAILGELRLDKGTSCMPSGLKVAYSAQQPWIVDDTIEANILGSCPMENPWYQAVLTAVCLTQDLASFEKGDKKMVGTRGAAISGGQRQRISLARAIYSRPNLLLLDDVFSGLDQRTAQQILNNVFGLNGLLSGFRCSTLLATNSITDFDAFNKVVRLHEGSVVSISTETEILKELSDANESSKESKCTEKPETSQAEDFPAIESPPTLATDPAENSAVANELDVYVYYVKTLGWQGAVVFFGIATTLCAEQVFQNVWLKMWAESAHSQDVGYYIGVFSALVVTGLVLIYLLCWFFFDILLPRALIEIYQRQLQILFGAPLRLTLALGGSTLANRFIQDIMLVDNELPMNFINTCTALLASCGETVLILLASKYLAASLPFLIGLLYAIQKFYLRTSKQVRLLDIEAKAPLTSHVAETLKAIVSIRAFGRAAEYTGKLAVLLRESQSAMYTLFSIQVWLKMVLDFVVALLAIFVVALAVGLRSNQSLGFLGLALVSLISLSASFKYLITFWTELEQAIGSLARIKHFNETTEQEDSSLLVPPPNWPQHGAIEFVGVTAAYSPSLPPVLREVNLTITPGQKIAICGRSGSGKSSLLSALLNCMELQSGSITIDGKDVHSFAANEVRKRITLLTQKPLVIPGSLRDSMTLWASLNVSDESARQALQSVGLWEKLVAITARDADDDDAEVPTAERKPEMDVSKTMDRPFNAEEQLSHGQRQLLCIARVVAQGASGSPIVLLDEITSNVDAETEAVMKGVLDKALENKTVIEVAHRLERIRDYDAIYLVEEGRLRRVDYATVLQR